MYKCVNNVVPGYLSCKLGKQSDAHAYNLRNGDHLIIPKCRTVAAQRGFFYRATKSWNNLSSETRSDQTLRSFKKLAKAELKLSQKVKLKYYCFCACLIQIRAPSGSLGLGTPLNLQRASPYNLESMNICSAEESTENID